MNYKELYRKQKLWHRNKAKDAYCNLREFRQYSKQRMDQCTRLRIMRARLAEIRREYMRGIEQCESLLKRQRCLKVSCDVEMIAWIKASATLKTSACGHDGQILHTGLATWICVQCGAQSRDKSFDDADKIQEEWDMYWIQKADGAVQLSFSSNGE